MAKKYLLMMIVSTLGWNFSFSETLKLGLYGEVEKLPYKGVDSDFTVLPMVYYESRYFYIDGLEAGFYFLNDDVHQLSLGLGYEQVGLKPSDSSNQQIKQLNRRKDSLMANIDYTYISDWGAISAEFKFDTLGRNKGVALDLGYLAMVQTGDFTFVPNIGVVWYSEKYNDYYYGVSQAESQRSGLAHYKSKQGINSYVELNILYQVAPNWEMFATGRYEHLSKEVKNSPVVDQKESTNLKLGVMYQF